MTAATTRKRKSPGGNQGKDEKTSSTGKSFLPCRAFCRQCPPLRHLRIFPPGFREAAAVLLYVHRRVSQGVRALRLLEWIGR